jgi:Xaa-Pro aminopeptidase
LNEVQQKLTSVRNWMSETKTDAVRLKGCDWFSWITAGASNVVLLAAETGIAEVLVTGDRALILTNQIESARLDEEELPPGFEIVTSQWFDSHGIERLVKKHTPGNARIFSDRPTLGETILPASFYELRFQLLPQEIERYRSLGRDAATAMTEALKMAEPSWSEERLAAEGAKSLLMRGIHPALILASGEERLPLRRHPTPSQKLLKGRGMMVFCARRHGLYANLTRFICFRPETAQEKENLRQVAEIESLIFSWLKPGVKLSEVFGQIKQTYEQRGFSNQVELQHFGGLTGYLSREVVARPEHCDTELRVGQAFAFNPTLPGAKIEDTVLLTPKGLEILTADPIWPTRTVAQSERPRALEKFHEL